MTKESKMNRIKTQISCTTHTGGASRSFIEVLEYEPNNFCITRTTSFDGAKTPDDQRKVDQFFLSAVQLNSFITVLQNAAKGNFDGQSGTSSS